MKIDLADIHFHDTVINKVVEIDNPRSVVFLCRLSYRLGGKYI